MESFERLFVHSYARGDGSRPTVGPQVSTLHTNALLSWALLLTICTGSQIREVLRKYELTRSFTHSLPHSNPVVSFLSFLSFLWAVAPFFKIRLSNFFAASDCFLLSHALF